MAVTKKTLRLVREIRADLYITVESSTNEMVKAWVRAWDESRNEWSDAIDDLLSYSPGEWPSRRQILRAAKATRALNHSTETLENLMQQAGVNITKSVGDVASYLPNWQGQIIASQLPAIAGPVNELVARFSRVDTRAINAIVQRTTEQITSDLNPLSMEMREAMFRSLVRGVQVGENPRDAARRMLQAVEYNFNGGLTRAMNVARTEILDAYRLGAQELDSQHSDVLRGWVWNAELSTRTCSSCWSMHGREFPLKQAGPLDHQQGRCSRLPQTKSWKELGFNIKEPPDIIPNAREMFNDLSAAEQIAILGPERMEGLKNGVISWNDLAQRRKSSGWRDSFAPIKTSLVRHRLNRKYSKVR